MCEEGVDAFRLVSLGVDACGVMLRVVGGAVDGGSLDAEAELESEALAGD